MGFIVFHFGQPFVIVINNQEVLVSNNVQLQV